MNQLVFFAPSGSACSLDHSSIFAIDKVDASSPTSGANHIGFFGAGGPQGLPFAVIVGKYQDATFVTNTSGFNMGVDPFGVPASGELINTKYEAINLATVSGVGGVSLSDIPSESGTILVRFVTSEPAPVRTQNVLCRTVVLNATNGVDDINGIAVGVTVQGFESGGDNAWTQTAGGGALDNRLFLVDHDVADSVHDYFVSLSASPDNAGERSDFGFFFVIEFL